jgi:DNA-binding NtrC family response regulator
MNVLLMDDTRKRRNQIKELLTRQHSVIDCFSSNEFISQIETGTFDIVLLDMDTWNKGASIYHYFKVGKQLEKWPVILYNTDDETPYLPDRTRHENDRILPKPFEIESLVESV